MSQLVRPARPEEYSRVGDLLVDAYAPSGMQPDQPYWAVLRDVATRADDAEVWVAIGADDQVTGTVTWCPPGSAQREISAPTEAEFRMLAVSPDQQGRGIGRLLLQAVIDRAVADDCAAVVLSSAAWMTTAHRLYERRGFTRTPDLDWSPAPGVHLRTFRLDLPPASAFGARSH